MMVMLVILIVDDGKKIKGGRHERERWSIVEHLTGQRLGREKTGSVDDWSWQ